MIPVLYNIGCVDASKENTIRFDWQGNQVFSKNCVIKKNDTNTIIYQERQTSMQLQHVIAANKLTNGVLYNVSISAIDKDGNYSLYSDPILFYCYSTPTFKFTNVSNNQIIRNSSYKVSLSYSQSEGEKLQDYEITLYDLSKSKIQTSGIQYSVDELDFTLTNLEDNQSYYLKASGKTINGLEFETEYIYFSVNYEQPAVYSIVTLENVPNEGYIKIQSNIRAVECKTNNTPKYINNDYIDLNNDTLSIDADFSLSNNFVIKFSGYNISEGLIMQLTDGDNTIYLYYRKGNYDINNNVDKVFLELNVPIGFTKYQCYSNYIDIPNKNDILDFTVQRENGFYALTLANKGVK